MKLLDYLKTKGEFKTKGKEAVFNSCIFCGRKHKLYVNIETGNYICFSANCNEKGNIYYLAEKENIKIDDIDINNNNKKEKVINDFDTELELNPYDFEFSTEMIEYFAKRGITKETLIESKVLYSKKYNAITFFFTAGLKNASKDVKQQERYIVGAKYRTFNKKIWAEKKSKPVLLGYDLIDSDIKEVYITEGEIDYLSLKEIGIKNTVSVPFGAGNFEWLEHHEEWLKDKKVILCFDNDSAGKKATEKLIQRIECKELYTLNLESTGLKDINDVLNTYGAIELYNLATKPKKVKIADIEKIENIERFDLNKIKRFKTGIHIIDYATRGFKESELILLAGEGGAGKTTLANQIIINAISQNIKTYIYNGELSKNIYKEWLYQQIGGEGCVETYYDKLFLNVKNVRVKQDIYKQIDEWINGKLFIDTAQTRYTEKSIIENMQKAYKYNDCMFFVIDNLSVIDYSKSSEKGYYEAMGDFVVELKEFAKTNNVVVLVLNHLTKGEGNSRNRIKGSGKIRDISDTVVLVSKGEAIERYINKAEIIIDKNRFLGYTESEDYKFSIISKRFFRNEVEKLEGFLTFKKQTEDDLPF